MTAQRIVSLSVFAAFILVGPGAAMAQNREEGKKIYVAYCTACHGEMGKGDGMAAQSFPVRPADHTNGAVMNQLTDRFLVDIITKGGSAVGKSNFMPAWGSSLKEKQIRDIVDYLRTIADPPYKPDKNKK